MVVRCAFAGVSGIAAATVQEPARKAPRLRYGSASSNAGSSACAFTKGPQEAARRRGANKRCIAMAVNAYYTVNTEPEQLEEARGPREDTRRSGGRKQEVRRAANASR